MDARADDADDPSTDDEVVHEPGEITYAEHLHPARPRALRHRARVRSPFERRSSARDGEPVGTNPTYVSWLLSESMLTDANTMARQFSGQGGMWQNPYADPNPRRAVDTASVWFTAYPLSLITVPASRSSPRSARRSSGRRSRDIGIEAVHTGPVKRAGGISGWGARPASTGTSTASARRSTPPSAPSRSSARCAGWRPCYGGTIIDDVVPGHTGKGADFRLAEMGFADYPGIYHMVEIEPDDWHCLPDVPAGHDSVNLDAATEERLEKAGYIIGRLQRVIFHAPGVKETNWSATAAVAGVDGIERRWVYLHYFKEGQPSINWLDPSFAGMRLMIGDALHSLADLGSGGLRLDANGFLGIEKSAAEGAGLVGGPPALRGRQPPHRQHGPQGRRVHLPGAEPDDGRHPRGRRGRRGPVLRLRHPPRLPPRAGHRRHRLPPAVACARASRSGIDPASLVHALQNHDEMTYELVHWATGHRDDVFTFRGERAHRRRARRHGAPRARDRARPARTPPTTWCSPPTGSPPPRRR